MQLLITLININIISIFLIYSSFCFSMSNDLIDIISYGLSNNIELQADRKTLLESKIDIDIERSALLPTLTGSLNTSWNSNNQTKNNTNDDYKSYNSNGYGLSLKQTIFDLKNLDKYHTKNISYSLEEVRYNNKKQDFILKISTLYFEYLKLRSQIIATEFEFKSSTIRERQLKRNIELGNVAANEIYEVLAQKEIVRNKLRTLKKDEDNTIYELSSLIQTTKIPSYDIKEELKFDSISNISKKMIIRKSLELNNELIISKKDVDISYNKLKESKSAFLPTLSLSGNFNHTDSNDYDRTDLTQTGINDSNNISLNLNIPILSGGSDYYKYKKSSINIQKKELLYKNTYTKLIVDIDKTIANINDISSAIVSFSNIVKNSHASYKGIQKAYQLGTRTITDLLSAENKQFNALRDYQNARYDYFLEVLKLEKLQGTLSLHIIHDLSKHSMEPIKKNVKAIPKHLIN